MPDGSCQEVDPLCCDDAGGEPSEWSYVCQGDDDGNGIDDACEAGPPIPTVSEWGLVAMTLVVLTAGTLVFMRHRQAQD